MSDGTAFEFATATKIVFGRGKVAELPRLVSRFGRRVLVVTGSSASRHAPTLEALSREGLQVSRLRVSGEPSVATVQHGVEVARAERTEVVVGLGGGSVIDAGKAIAALARNPLPPLDYLEVVGRGAALSEPSAPFLAVPTTSGTGAEVTKNAVLEAEEHGVKVSLRNDSMLPKVALVDPLLTLSVPPAVTAATGLDALTQLIEPYLSRHGNPLVDAIAVAGIRHARQGLRRAFHAPEDVEAREHMSLASLFGGLCLANAKLGAVHGLAGPLGAMTHGAHGALCARLLPAVLRANWKALAERATEHGLRARFDALGALLTEGETPGIEAAIAWISELIEELSVPRLGAHGLTREMLGGVVKKAQRASSMQGNPIALYDEEVHAILEACL